MRKKKPILIGLVSLFFVFYCYQIVLSFSSQPPVSRTNAPGESSCINCHSGILNSGAGGVTYSFGNNDTAYFPNVTYSITVTVNDPILTRFGFQMTALTQANTSTPGFFSVVNSTNTSLNFGTVGGNSRQYIGQFNANSNNTWTFNWVAPATDVGPITFYLIGNATNNNNSSTGDQVYATNFTIAPPPPVPPVADFSVNDTSVCPGSTVIFSDQSTLQPTSWNWSFPGGSPATSGSNMPSVTYATPGTYDVTLIATNANGSDTLQRTGYITVLDTPSANLDQIIPPTCAGGFDAQVNITPTGGSGPYSFVWSNLSTNEDLAAVGAGSYSVTVRDDNNCTGTVGPFVVTGPSPVVVVIDSVASASCGANTGAVFANASGGTGSLSYQWNTGSTASFIDNLPGGGYVVTATDSNGCSDSVSAVVNVIGAPTLSASVFDLECHEDSTGEISVNISGGVPPYTFSWNTGDTSTVLTNLGAGGYSITVTDSTGCSAFDSFTVFQPDPMVLVMNAQDESFAGAMDGKAWVTVTGGTPAYLYFWDTSPMQTTDTASGLAGGVYSVEVEDENGCFAEDTIFVGTLINNEPLLSLEDLKVYPNPTEGFVTISFEGNQAIEQISLFDARGIRVIWVENPGSDSNFGSQQVRVPMETLSQGVYNLEVRIGNQSLWRKVIKR